MADFDLLKTLIAIREQNPRGATNIASSIDEYQTEQQTREQGFQDMLQEAVMKAQIEQQYGAPQEWQPTTMEEALALKKAGKTTSQSDIIKNILGGMGGIVPPEEAFGADVMERAPLDLGRAGGGRVISPMGATLNEGEILKGGKRIGEFLPGYEPRREPEAVAPSISQRLGIGKEEAGRKFLGLGKTKEKKEVKRSAFDKKMIGQIRALIQANASLEDIISHIRLQGAEPENYAEHFKDYAPKKKTSGFPSITGAPFFGKPFFK